MWVGVVGPWLQAEQEPQQSEVIPPLKRCLLQKKPMDLMAIWNIKEMRSGFLKQVPSSPTEEERSRDGSDHAGSTKPFTKASVTLGVSIKLRATQVLKTFLVKDVSSKEMESLVLWSRA